MSGHMPPQGDIARINRRENISQSGAVGTTPCQPIIFPVIMNSSLNTATRYPMSAFLEGRCAPKTYSKWLRVKADCLLRRDKKRGKPPAFA
jgi:hypothetical protein